MRSMLAGLVVVALAAPAFAQDAHICPFGQGLFGEEEVKIDGNASVNAYTPGEPPTFEDTAVVRSNQLVRLDGNARIGGDAVSGGLVTRQGGNTVITGSTMENAEALAYPGLADWILSREEANSNDAIPATANGEQAVRDGKLDVRANDTLTLPGGDYFFAEVDVKGTLRTTGSVRFFVAGRMDVSGQAQLNPDAEPATLYVFSASELARAVRFSGQSRSFCLVYAMRTEVQVSVNSEVYGAIVSKRIEIAGNAQFHYRPGSGDSCFDVGMETVEPSKQFGGNEGGNGNNAGGNGNNGVGNGEDPQPPGNPPQNDGEGTGPGDPGNQGGPNDNGNGGGNGNGNGGNPR